MWSKLSFSVGIYQSRSVARAVIATGENMTVANNCHFVSDLGSSLRTRSTERSTMMEDFYHGTGTGYLY
jgi:hypothetical protein